jgi:hypothetical protein
MKTFPSPSMHAITLSISPGATGSDGYYDAMAYFFAMTPNLTDFGLSGYPTMNNNSYIGAQTAPGKSNEAIKAFFDPIAARMRQYGANVSVTPRRTNTTRTALARIPDVLGDYYREQKGRAVASLHLEKRQRIDMTPVHQIPVRTMSSRLIARSALFEANMPAIKAMLQQMTGNILPYGNAGGAVTRNRNLDVAVNPAWRDAAMHLIVINFNITSNLAAMDKLSVNHGAYFNEAYDQEADWKTVFWGPESNYKRLLEVKKKYDPNNTLWCMPCVGGDAFVEKEGRLWSSK